MFKDPIVQSVRKFRDANASKFNYDINAIIEDAQKRQKALKDRIVSFVIKPKKPHNNRMNLTK